MMKVSTERLIQKLMISVVALCSISSCSWIRGLLKYDYAAEGALLEWEFLIPPPSFIIGSGIPNLPKHNDVIIAHTTIQFNLTGKTDNRLFGINERTDEILWYFPADLSVPECCDFDANGYQYDGKIVFRYRKRYALNGTQSIISTVCLDIETGDVLWEHTDSQHLRFSTKDVIGLGSTCYYVENGSSIYKLDMTSMETSYLCTFEGKNIYSLCLTSDNRILVLCPEEDDMYNIANHIFIIDRESADIYYEDTFANDSSYSSAFERPAGVTEHNGFLYLLQDLDVTAVDISTGELKWKQQRDGTYHFPWVGLVCTDDILFVLINNELIAYNPITGEELYTTRDTVGGAKKIIVRDNLVFLCDGWIDVLDYNTGAIVDKLRCKREMGGDDFRGTNIVFHDDQMYAMTGWTICRYPKYYPKYE